MWPIYRSDLADDRISNFTTSIYARNSWGGIFFIFREPIFPELLLLVFELHVVFQCN